ncbi:MAG: hypothetical protein AAB614_00560 [Patescibacteria group bacterium]
MIDFINNIQGKPKHVRVRIFLVIMIIAVILIFILWLNSIKESISTVKNNKGDASSMPTIYESVSASIKDIFKPQSVRLK